MFLFRKSSQQKPRQKVLYIVKNYPQLSQTYIKHEIATVNDDYEVRIIALSRPNVVDPDHHPYKIISERESILKAISKFKPGVIHSHYLNILETVNDVSRLSGVPFTMRTHSFDVLGPLYGSPHSAWDKLPDLANGDNCLGILCFPFLRKSLIEAGVLEKRVIGAPPVLDTRMFYNRSENGTAILNMGAALPKKKMDDFIALSKQVPEREFNLFAVGHISNELQELNARTKGRVRFRAPVRTREMRAIYKQHGWLVYTACHELKTVGWPMAIAEAQAAGVGICMADLRPDLREYAGESAYLYKDVSELPELLRTKLDREKREAGFENALSLDIRLHISKLTGLWHSAA